MILGPDGKVLVEDENVKGVLTQLADTLKKQLDADAKNDVVWSDLHTTTEYVEFMLRDLAS